MFSNWKASLAAAALLVPAMSAQAVIVFGPNGLGGFNAYERSNNQVNYAAAITGSQVAMPGDPTVIGHIADFTGSADYEFLVGRRVGAPANIYIGLTDNVANTPGATEGGNTAGGALPANGVDAAPTQRGFGWAFVATGDRNQFHQRTPGVSIWGVGEPNGGAGESAAEIRTDGLLNDIGEGNTRPFVREWDLNLASAPTSGADLKQGTPGLFLTDIRNVGTVTNANYQAIAAAPPGGAVIMHGLTQTMNLGGGANGNFGGDDAFPQGGGDNFIIVANGFIEIPVAGAYTFQMNQDDTIFFSIGTNGAPQTFQDTGCCDVTRTTMVLDAGIFEIEIIFAEFGGGEHVELAAAFGANITDASLFRIIGDTANGGLAVFASDPTVPEPATAMLGMIGMGLLSLRRRRVA